MREAASTRLCRKRSISALLVPSWAASKRSPIRCEDRVRSWRAARLGEYPSRSMTDWTRSRVSGRSSSGLFKAFETVCRETPASSATVASVGGVTGADRWRPRWPSGRASERLVG